MITGSRGAYNERRAGIDTRVVIKYIPDDLLFVTSAVAGKEKRKECERKRKRELERARELRASGAAAHLSLMLRYLNERVPYKRIELCNSLRVWKVYCHYSRRYVARAIVRI